MELCQSGVLDTVFQFRMYRTSLLVKEIKPEVNTFWLLARVALCHRHQRAPASVCGEFRALLLHCVIDSEHSYTPSVLPW